MPTPCPICGARLAEGETCASIFDTFLVLEFSDPAYGEVHMLTVACFMIQHNRYSDSALLWMRDTLAAHLDGGLSPQEIRRGMGITAANDQRAWKVLRQPDEHLLPAVAWSVTIADVAHAYHGAAGYCAQIRRWARATLNEMPALLPPSA